MTDNFNPDEYLAEEEEFNPDSYLAEDEFNPESYLDEDQPEPKMGAGEAMATQAADIIPGLGGLTAGIAGKSGELYSEHIEGSPVSEADAKLKELGIQDPSKQLNNEGEERGTFQEARMGQIEKENKAFEDQPAASIVGAIAAPGVGMLKLAKHAPKLVKLASKSETVQKGLLKILPSIENLEKIKKIEKTLDVHKQYGRVEKLKKAQKMIRGLQAQQALREGFKIGALTGLTKTENPASLEALENMGKYGLFAGLGGKALVKTGQTFSGLISRVPGIKTIMKSYSYGKSGDSLDVDSLDEGIFKTGKKFVEDVNGLLGKTGGKQNKVYELMDEAGITINTKQDLEKVRTLASTKLTPTEQKQAEKFFNMIDDYLVGGKEQRKVIKKIQDNINKRLRNAESSEDIARIKVEKQALNDMLKMKKDIVDVEEISEGATSAAEIGSKSDFETYGKSYKFTDSDGKEIIKKYTADIKDFDPSKIHLEDDIESGRKILSYVDRNTGKNVSEIIEVPWTVDPAKMSFQESQLLIDKLRDFSYLAKQENMPSFVKKLVTEQINELQNKMHVSAKDKGFNLANLRKKIHNLNNLKEVKSGPKFKGKQVTSVEKSDAYSKVNEFIKKPASGGKIEQDEIQGFFGFLEKGSPDLYNKYRGNIEKLRELYSLAKPTEMLVEKSTSFKNLLGTIQGALNKGANVAGLKRHQIGTLIDGITQSKNIELVPFLKPLQKAQNTTERTRQAIMYGLYSNPAFRKGLGIKKDKKED